MIYKWNKARPPHGAFTFNKDCPQAQGMVAWYPGSAALSSALDFSGSNLHLVPGTAAGSATQDEGGAPALVFAGGSSQYLLNSTYPILGYPFSVAQWFRHDSGLTNQISFAFGHSANTVPTQRLDISATDKVTVTQRDDASVLQSTSGTVSVPAGTWHHGAAVFVASNSRSVFTDGADKATGTTAMGTTTLNNTAMGVWFRGTLVAPWTGAIGETCIYSVDIEASGALARITDPALRYELWYPLRSQKWISLPAAVAAGSLITKRFGIFQAVNRAASF